jgi:hypothetical protein
VHATPEGEVVFHVPTPSACSICSRPDRDQIDAALRARTPLRSISKTFGGGSDIRTGLKNHAVGCITGLGRGARANAKGGRPRNAPAPAAASPIGDLDAPQIMLEYGQLYAESRALLELAKQSGDMVRVDKALAGCVNILDRHAKAAGIFADGGTTVNIDARQQKVVALYDSLPTEVLERLAAGTTTIERVLEEAGASR